MKNIIKFGFVLCAALAVFSCKEMDATYKDLIVPGGIKYPQKATNVMVYSGEGRIKVCWDKGGDPSVSKAIIYWDNFSNQKELTITGEETEISTIITDLVEKDYSFIIKTFDELGNSSVPIEINSKSYGDFYKSSILNGNRIMTDAYYAYPPCLRLAWAGAERGVLKTEVTYKTTEGDFKTIELPKNESFVSCIDYDPGTEISYTSKYLPDSTCMDMFSTAIETYTPDFPYEFKFDRSTWIAKVSSFHPGAGGGEGPILIDGKYSANGEPTYWHSGDGDKDIWVSVDMKESIRITTLILTSRKFTDWKLTKIAKFTLQGSNDGASWEDIGDPHDVVETEDGPMHLHFPINATKFYSQFKIKITHNGGGYVSLGDVDIRGFRPE